MSELTVEQVRHILRYEPDTGRLLWLPRPREMFTWDGQWQFWNERYAGTEAFTACDAQGYRVGNILGRQHKAHRVIWLLQTGEWPTTDIDHINGVRGDNRWSNLRAIPHAENLRNMGRQSNNTSGVCGVSWRKRERKWWAQIQVSGRKKHLGLFDTIEAATAARAAANAKYGFSERHGKP